MNQKTTEITLSLGDITINMQSVPSLCLDPVLQNFCVWEQSPDHVLKIVETDIMPALPKNKMGEDLLMDYYKTEDVCYAVGKPGTAGLIVVTEYLSDYSRIIMYVRKSRPAGLFESFKKALQLLPVRGLLLQNHALMLHSSQIVIRGIGILFSAPSGTGKSTQARLWQQYEEAEIICNDRTVLRRQKDVFYTYGYPVDGSDPVCSREKNHLGAIVVLRQAEENHIERLKSSKALIYLMEQTVSDVWDQGQRNRMLELWMSALEQCPVYCLYCRPDREAVICLKERLEKDGVIECRGSRTGCMQMHQ